MEKYKNYCRLNTKRLEKYLLECQQLNTNSKTNIYEMNKLFPLMTTRSKKMKSKDLIACFKSMANKYVYCYKLEKSCLAMIPQRGAQDLEHKYKPISSKYIDNNLYVFNNIDSDCIIKNDDYELVYNLKQPIILKEFNKNDLLIYSSRISDIVDDLKNRRISSNELNLLDIIINKYDILPPYDHLIHETKQISLKTYTEFFWRYHLYYEDIYYRESVNYDDCEVRKNKSLLKIDNYSLLKDFNKHISFENITKLISSAEEEISEFLYYYNNNMKLNKIRTATYLIENGIVDNLKETFGQYSLYSIIHNKTGQLYNLLHSYKFLFEPYSKEYKTFFKKYRKIFSKWKTQEILRKYRTEYKEIESIYKNAIKVNQNILNIQIYCNEIESIYKNAKNEIEHVDFGYFNDGRFNDYDTDSLEIQIQGEKEWAAKQEREYQEQLELEYQLQDPEYLKNIEEDEIKEFKGYQLQLIDALKWAKSIDLQGDDDYIYNEYTEYSIWCSFYGQDDYENFKTYEKEEIEASKKEFR